MTTMPGGYIIEHDTRGVLMDQDVDPSPSASGPLVNLGWRSRFSAIASRGDGLRLFTEADAVMAWSRLSETIQRGARVRRWGSWTQVRVDDLRRMVQ